MTDKQRTAIKELAVIFRSSDMTDETFMAIMDGIMETENTPVYIPVMQPWIKSDMPLVQWRTPDFTTTCSITQFYNKTE